MHTADLRLASDMGAAAPLVLLLVDRPNKDVYYLCLVDYIKYVLDETSPKWRSQKSTLVRLPVRNRLSDPAPAESANRVHYFQSLAYRGKLFGSNWELLFRATRDAVRSRRMAIGSRSRHGRGDAKCGIRVAVSLDKGLRACESLTSTGLAGSRDPYAGCLRPQSDGPSTSLPNGPRETSRFRPFALTSTRCAKRSRAQSWRSTSACSRRSPHST